MSSWVLSSLLINNWINLSSYDDASIISQTTSHSAISNESEAYAHGVCSTLNSELQCSSMTTTLLDPQLLWHLNHLHYQPTTMQWLLFMANRWLCWAPGPQLLKPWPFATPQPPWSRNNSCHQPGCMTSSTNSLSKVTVGSCKDPWGWQYRWMWAELEAGTRRIAWSYSINIGQGKLQTLKACRWSALSQGTSNVNPDPFHLTFQHMSLSAQHEAMSLNWDDRTISRPAPFPEPIPLASVLPPTKSTALKSLKIVATGTKTSKLWITILTGFHNTTTSLDAHDSITASAAHVSLTMKWWTDCITTAAGAQENQMVLVLFSKHLPSSLEARDILAKVHRIVSVAQLRVLEDSSWLNDKVDGAEPRPFRGPQGQSFNLFTTDL